MEVEMGALWASSAPRARSVGDAQILEWYRVECAHRVTGAWACWKPTLVRALHLDQPEPAELQGIPDESLPAVLQALQRLRQLLPSGSRHTLPPCGHPALDASDRMNPGPRLELSEALQDIRRITALREAHAFVLGIEPGWRITVPADPPLSLEQLCTEEVID
jgi:hypothetical protein